MQRTPINPLALDLQTPGLALDLQTPGRRDYFVTLEHSSLWAQHLVPVTVIVGDKAQPGRGLLVTGSVHGDEMEGPIAIKHLLSELRTEDIVGRVILVPVLNVMAFRANRRESPDDGKNLNREFPGASAGDVTARLADLVSRYLFPHVHAVADIHSGGEVARFAPLTDLHRVSDAAQQREIERMARGFGAKFVMVYQNLTQGLLTSEAENLGKIAVGTELGWGRAVQPRGVAMARQGVLTALVQQGQMRGEPPANRHCPADEQVLVDTSDPASSLLAPRDGEFEPLVELGARVARGERIGWLHDFQRIDEAPLELLAAHEGYVICQAWNARVVQGQVITQIGRPVEWTCEPERTI
jgi:N-alpha-acetyl-L-2,4-diaminobutyrate deacetylase